jgi:hypothetical protein
MLSNIFALTALTAFYLFFFYSYYFSNKKYFIAGYIILFIFHDFIFINLGYHMDESIVIILKSWQEMLFLFLFLNFCLNLHAKGLKIQKSLFVTFLILLLLTAWGISVDLKYGANEFDIFVGWRRVMLTLFNSVLLYAVGVFDNVSLKEVHRILVVITVFIMAFGFYQYIQFESISLPSQANQDNDFYTRISPALKEFWFHEKFGTLHMLRSWPNYIRNDSPRITSIFVSPIILAEFLAVMALFSIITLLKGKPKLLQILLHLSFLSLVFVTMEMSHTRIGFAQILIGTAIALFIRREFKSQLYWVIIFIAVFSLMLILSVTGMGDDSAQGRLAQYRQVMHIFSSLGFGYAAEAASFYDSLYISVILVFGVGCLFYFYLHYHWTATFFRYRSYFGTHKGIDLEFRIIAAIICSFIFAFTFQYSLGSAAVTLLYLLLFLGISRQKKFHQKP